MAQIKPRLPPFGLIVSPDGRHGVLISKEVSETFDERGSGWWRWSAEAVAFNDRVFIWGQPVTWDEQPVSEEHSGENRGALVRRIEGERFAFVAAGLSMVAQVPQPPRVLIQGGRRARSAPSSDWVGSTPGRAVAAIGADFTAFLALDNGKLQVWPPHADSQGIAVLGAERNVGVTAKWISLVGAHVMLLAPEGAGYRLQAFTTSTVPVYSIQVPFEVLQPAIAGAGDRVYLAGKGLAAIDKGKITWSHLSPEPIYASSFEDGSLALATGKRLDFVKPDGTIDQSFNADEPLVAPPAIAADGSVWAASAEALYLAR